MSPPLVASVRDDTGRGRTAVSRVAGACLAARPRCREGLREESNLCARVRSPLLSSAELRRQGGGFPPRSAWQGAPCECGRRGSNPHGSRPPASEASAVKSAELQAQDRTVLRALASKAAKKPPAGIEPAPRPYKGRVLAVDTTEACGGSRIEMMEPEGFEPSSSRRTSGFVRNHQ